MSRLAISLLVVLAAACTDAADSGVRFSWGGQDGSKFSDDGASTRSGPTKPCPDWGSIDGPVTGLVAHVVVDGYAIDQTFDCRIGNAELDVPSGTGSITFEEALVPGTLVGDARWDHALTLVDGQTLDIGCLDLDEELVHSTGGGGCGDTGCGDNDWPF